MNFIMDFILNPSAAYRTKAFSYAKITKSQHASKILMHSSAPALVQMEINLFPMRNDSNTSGMSGL